MKLNDRWLRIKQRGKEADQDLELVDNQQGLGLVTERDFELPEADNAAEATIEQDGAIRVLNADREDNHRFAFETIPKVFEEKMDAVHAANAEVNILRVTQPGHHEIDISLPDNSYTHNILHVPEDITATILINYETDKEGFSTEFLDLLVDKDASAHVTEIRRGKQDHALYTRREAGLHENATLHWTQCDTGSHLLTNYTKTHLQGNNSEGRTTNLFYGTNGQRFDVSLESHHTGEETYSFIRSRGALRSAKSTQRGLVRINKPAFDADGYQKADNLLLNDDANAVSIPDLEIRNPEVQCSHGSTVSDLDEEQLFYLQTRGYHELAAKKILIQGFFEPYISKVQPEEARETLRELLIENIQDDLHHAR
jgi:Fe-S cluster assembly scaffold protein SufB